MTKTATDMRITAGDGVLLAQAKAGVESAFEELFRRYGRSTWALAWATSGDETSARATTATAFGRAFTALRSGRAIGIDFLTLVHNQAINAATDVTSARAVAPATGDPATRAFLRLPAVWRASLWLRHGEGASLSETAAAVGLGESEIDKLTQRAAAGWREQLHHEHVTVSGSRNCSRAIARLHALDAGSLPDSDVEPLERHLRLCEPCSDRRAMLDDLTGRLSNLAPALPVLLVDDAKAAWYAAVSHSTTRTGLTSRTEKVLAGATAAVAALGMVGAAVIGAGQTENDARADLAGPAVAPIVTELSSPLPVKLAAAIDLPRGGSTPAAIAGRSTIDSAIQGLSDAGRKAVPVTGGLTEPISNPGTPTPPPPAPGSGPGENPGGGDLNNEGPGDSEVPGGTVPTVSVSTTVADIPVAVVVGDEPGVTVGPVTVGSQPESSSTEGVSVGGPLAPVQPVVETVAAPLGLG